MESFTTEAAVEYSRKLLAALKGAEDVSFTVRAWLKEGMDNLAKEENLPVQFKSQQGRKPLLKATDKCILTRAIM